MIIFSAQCWNFFLSPYLYISHFPSHRVSDFWIFPTHIVISVFTIPFITNYPLWKLWKNSPACSLKFYPEETMSFYVLTALPSCSKNEMTIVLNAMYACVCVQTHTTTTGWRPTSLYTSSAQDQTLKRKILWRTINDPADVRDEFSSSLAVTT